MSDGEATARETTVSAEALERRLIPCFDEFYETVLGLLPAGRPDRPYRVLEIGAETGLLALLVLDRLPEAELTLIDPSEKALALARERLGDLCQRVECRAGKLTNLAGGEPYDAVISAVTLHVLENRQKRTVFSAAYAALRRGGRMIHADQVRGPSETLEARYVETWLEMVRAGGASEKDLAAPNARRAKDRLATVAQHLEMMADDGFENVDCFYKNWCFAVMAGDKI